MTVRLVNIIVNDFRLVVFDFDPVVVIPKFIVLYARLDKVNEFDGSRVSVI
eukprot:CAMPEP_0168317766 /NCGR_PEP_ID=MMETSP0213-20121227/84_1 /TAXON_ID=151035 /ORGANISM="Euplotes harpa, Strain FSP1.4" /LENGTH=50 /DNA_ID=CAMNT_0008318715 /DNA_START=760 /DNA_END=912 /DNA_ORIENTATION=+